jgi:pilus assembly protein FimV
MPRVPLAAVWLLAGLIPLSVGALGLGEISLKSALNQVLVAEIPVTADASDDLSGLEVRLASAETFQRFGLDRPQFLNTLNFAVEGDGGASRIRVTSSLPISEPFVSLLLDISWPQGHLLREYTMLLDPPAFAREGAVQSAAALPVVTSPTPAVKRIERADEPAPGAVAGAGQADAAAVSDGRLVAGPDGSSYGPVRANETLWAISDRLSADDGVSLNAMMVALYRANPEAFAGNINLLKRGAILRVPAAAELAALSAGEASGEVRRQNEAWRAGAESSPTAARLQLVPPEEKPLATAPSAPVQQPLTKADAAQVRALEQQLAESRRLLELKDSELKTLQDRLQSEQQSLPVEAPVEAPIERLPVEDSAVPPTDETSASDEEAVVEDSAEPAVPAARSTERATAKRKPKRSESSWLDSLGGLIFNSYFLIAAAAVVLAGLFVVFGRRRMAKVDDDSTGRFPTTLPRGSSVGGAAKDEPTLREGFIVEESEAQRTAEITAERTAVAGRGGRNLAGDSETALERTISTDGAVEIDQADVIAEAEFHMAYGLYDQAAELLVRALRDNPDRRDLRLKLLEVYFIWENKPAFLKEAQTFHRQPGGAASPDWNKVLIMGKQICPGESLFAAGAGTAGLDISLDSDSPDSPDSVDFILDDSAGENVDLDLTGARRGPAADLLDFDFGEIAGTDDTGLMQTEIAPGPQGNESPTVEAVAGSDFSPTMETPTMETPTVEFRGPDAPTVETPTLETPAAGTMETPTIESAAISGSRAQLADLGGHDHTEEINLEDLGLDLTGLDVAAGDMGTGLHAAVAEGALDDGSDGEVFDIGDPDADVDEDLSDLLQSLEGDATSEMRSMSLDEGTLDLPAFGTALEKSAASREAGADDTIEQPVGGRADSALGEQSGELSEIDFDIGAEAIEDAEPTSVVTPRGRRGPEGPTMTEVGTKLDLARAYVDMGDPEGARSILNEVLEEGDSAQQQEARKLLDELAD